MIEPGRRSTFSVSTPDANGWAWFLFWCPGCGEHHGVPISGPKAWGAELDEHGKPTLTPSLLIRGRQQCHVFIRAGRIEFLGDCSHACAGTTVDLPSLP